MDPILICAPQNSLSLHVDHHILTVVAGPDRVAPAAYAGGYNHLEVSQALAAVVHLHDAGPLADQAGGPDLPRVGVARQQEVRALAVRLLKLAGLMVQEQQKIRPVHAVHQLTNGLPAPVLRE